MDQGSVSLEKRFSPRIKCRFPISVYTTAVSETIDLSEGGACFTSEKAFPRDVSMPACIDFRSCFFDTRFQVVWKRAQPEGGRFLYGVRHVNLENDRRIKLRGLLIKEQVGNILDKAEESQIRDKISHYFFSDIKGYLEDLDELNEELSTKEDYDSLLGRKLTSINDRIVLKGNSLEKNLNKLLAKAVKEHFRFLIGTFAYKSLIVKRAFEKPQGYPGDYKMLEDVYNNQPYSEGIGRYYDKYFLDNPYAVAVRLRKDKLREMLYEFIVKNSDKISLKILDLACGSSREIAELVPKLNYQGELIFTCIDWDQEALEFSQKVLQGSPANIKFNFLKEDILNLIKEEKKLALIGEQDLIYSIGLIDYLPDRILKRWLYFFYQLLSKGGKFIVTHKNKDKTFPSLPPNWFCDWKFVPRSTEEATNVLNNSGMESFSLNVESDNFGYIYYFIITKNNFLAA